MAAAVSLVAFFAWWGAWIRSTLWGIVACVVAILGLACDLLAESLFIGWLPVSNTKWICSRRSEFSPEEVNRHAGQHDQNSNSSRGRCKPGEIEN